jgi:hypothetical protein
MDGRTISGESTIEDLSVVNLDASNDITCQDLFVSGNTTITGGVVDLADITANTLHVNSEAHMLGTLQVDDTSFLDGGVQTVGIDCTSVTAAATVTGHDVVATSAITGGSLIVTAARINGLNASSSVQTDASKQLVSVANTGTGLNVLQNNATISNATMTGSTAAASINSAILQCDSLSVLGPSTSVFVSSTQNSSSTSTGAVILNGGIGIGGNCNAANMRATTAMIADVVQANSSTNATTNNTGGLTCPSGGISCGKDVWAGARLIANSTDEAISNNTGGITTAGGISCVKSIYTTGNITVPIGYVSSSQLTCIGTLDSTASTNGSINTGGGIGCAKNMHVGQTVTSNATSTGSVSVTGSGTSLSVSSTTDSVSTSSGSIVTQGGVGVQRNLVVGGVGQVEISQNATSAITGAIRCTNGGIGCKQDIWTDGNLHVQNIDARSSISVNGPLIGVRLQLNAGGIWNALVSEYEGGSDYALVMNSDGSYDNVRIINLTNINNNPFSYVTGNFTPRISSLLSNGSSYNLSDFVGASIDHAQGYYQKCGQCVDVFFDAQIAIPGAGNAYTDAVRLPAITDLPFVCTIPSVAFTANAVSTVTVVSWPNGYAGSVPAPFAVLFPEPFEIETLEPGTPYEPRRPPVYPAEPQWANPDGRTAVFNCMQSTWSGALDWEGYGTVYNFNILTTGNYVIRFKAQMRYFSVT